MKKNRFAFVWLMSAFVIALFLVTPTTSFAATTQKAVSHVAQTSIQPVSCGNSVSFVKIYYNHGASTECFAYDGYLGLGSTRAGNLGNVTQFHMGNNCGWFVYNYHGTSNKIFFIANDADFYFSSAGVIVTQLDIEGQNCYPARSSAVHTTKVVSGKTPLLHRGSSD